MWEDAGADVAERMADTGGPEWNVLEEHTVGETMNRTVSALPPDTPVEHAAEVMRRATIHRVLVMEDGKLLGVVTTKDITDAVADHRFTNRVYVFGNPASDRGN
jgi:CBS domain-containing protein